MNVGSLFAGIGGFDLGFERAGYDIRWQVEIDPWARAVLAKHWPHVHRHDDISTAGAHNLETVDVLCGGFPCQDISLAGKGAGIADGTRSGLWSEYARLIRELRPRYVVVENVAALLARGLGRVVGDLAACGYDAEWDCIPAAAVGAPHRRDRLWLVAYSSRREQGWWNESQWRPHRRDADASRHGAEGRTSDVADANGQRCVWGGQQEPTRQQGARGDIADGGGKGRASTTSTSCRDPNHGLRHQEKKRPRRPMPTPSASDYKGSSSPGQRRGQLTDPACGVIPAGGQLNPQFVEWLMGYPIDHTALEGWATPSFRKSPNGSPTASRTRKRGG
jgi:DNA-cytosine methyltransferase